MFIELLAAGGFIVLRKQDEFLAFWSYPKNAEFEKITGVFKFEDIGRREITRCSGRTTWLDSLEEIVEEFEEAVEDGWKVWRHSVYHKNIEDLPEGFEDVDHLLKSKKVYRAQAKTGRLISLLPEDAGKLLYQKFGIAIQYVIKI